MNNSWELLKKELSIHGISILDDGKCQSCNAAGEVITQRTPEAIDAIKQQIDEQKIIFKFLWKEAMGLLHEGSAEKYDLSSTDSRLIRLFVASLKDMGTLVDSFEELDGSILKRVVLSALMRDVTEYSPGQIKVFPDYKIAIDWTLRAINRISYVLEMVRLSSSGEHYVNSFEIKTAKVQGVSGPWANLDLPMLERVWSWKEEDENLRGRMRDIRKQRRYTQGLENYNNDGRVGEGFYWREMRNEPFSWYNKTDDDPYYQRYVLTRK